MPLWGPRQAGPFESRRGILYTPRQAQLQQHQLRRTATSWMAPQVLSKERLRDVKFLEDVG